MPISSIGDNRNNLQRQHPSFAAQQRSVFITAHGCARKKQTLFLSCSSCFQKLTLVYIPARSAAGGLAYNFTPQQWVDCLWTQRRGERRGGGGEKMESVKGWRRCLKLSVLSPIIRGQLQNTVTVIFNRAERINRVENFNRSPCSTRLIRKVSTTLITWERAHLRFQRYALEPETTVTTT